MTHWMDFMKHINRRIRGRVPSLAEGPVSLWACPEGIKFFYRQSELTKNVGLSFAWKELDAWHDCSAWNQRILKWTPYKLMIEKFSSNDRIIFELLVKKESSFHCRIEASISSSPAEMKVIFMLQGNYKHWIAGIHEGPFPAMKNWLRVGVPDPAPEIIGAHSESVSDLIPVLFSFKGAVHSLENSDAETGGRILAAACRSAVLPFMMEGDIRFFPSHEKWGKELHQIRVLFLSEKSSNKG